MNQMALVSGTTLEARRQRSNQTSKGRWFLYPTVNLTWSQNKDIFKYIKYPTACSLYDCLQESTGRYSSTKQGNKYRSNKYDIRQ